MKDKNYFLIAILVIAFLIRLIYLNRFPIGMTHDELNYIFTAKSLFLTHSFPQGTAPAIIPTGMTNINVTVAEIPAVVLGLVTGSLPMSLFTGRVIGAVFSVLAVWAVYLISLHIGKKRFPALVSAFLLAINPWSILMGRTVFEANFFVAFFLWGLWVLLKSKGWKIFRALPLYLLGFFSYTGGQISFFVFMVITLIYHYFTSGQNKKDLKIYVVFTGLISLIFAGYVFVAMRNQTYKARGNELYLPNLPKISETVNDERKLSVQTPVNSLFINKATVYFSGFIKKYLNTFSVNNLFLTGETRAAFSYQTHGTFYLIDFLFIIIGISSLYLINKKGWLFFLAVVAGCSLTSGLNVVESSYSQRVGLIYPFLVMTVGFGVWSVISSVRSAGAKRLLVVAVSSIYLISLANLLHIYFIRFPVYASDGWFFQDRVLARYIDATEKSFSGTKVFVYTPEPKITFEEYLFYTNHYNSTNASTINGRLGQKDYSFNNVFFSEECPTELPKGGTVTIFDGSFRCDDLPLPKENIRITRLRDVYANYLIYNDRVCKDFGLSTYISQSAYKNFSVEDQTVDDFCQNWITEIKQ